MLTKQDLNAIGNLIDTKLENKLEIKFEEKLAPIRSNIKSIEENVGALQKDIVVIKSGVKKLRKDLTTTINFFDKSDNTLLNKLNKTRSEIGLRELNFA